MSTGTTTAVSAEVLRETCVEALERAGVPRSKAEAQAVNLVEADLRGHPSHGVSRLRVLLERIANRVIDVAAEPALERHTAVTATLDACDDLGPSAAERAMAVAMEMARLHGVGVVSVRRANHLGLLATYVEKAAQAGVIAVLTSTTEAMVHPPHSTEALLGTNPLAIAIPVGAGAPPVVLDMATSTVSMGEVLRLAATGASVPGGWGLDAGGLPALEASDLAILSTFGGSKGYGLSLCLGVVTSMLAGMPLGEGVRGTLDTTSRSTKADLVICIDPAAFGGFGPSEAPAAGYLDRIRHSRSDGRGAPPYVPGDRSRRLRAERLRTGIPMEPDALNDFFDAAGVDHRTRITI